MFRGSAIDKRVRELVQQDPKLAERLCGCPNKGVDSTDSLTGETFDMTTPSEMPKKFKKYGPDVQLLNTQ